MVDATVHPLELQPEEPEKAEAPKVESEPKKKKKKKKRRYSPGYGALQDIIRASHIAATIASRGMAKEFAELERGWERSSKKKRDGGLKDFTKNVARAASRNIRELSKMPVPVVQAAPKVRIGTIARIVFPPLWLLKR